MRGQEERTVVQLLSFVPQSQRSMDLFLLSLSETLKKKNWRSVFVFEDQPSASYQKRLEELQIPYFTNHFPVNKNTLPDLINQLLPFQPDVMMTTFMSPFNPALWRLKKAIGAEYWLQVDQTSGRPSKQFPLRKYASQARGAVAGRHIDQIVGVSQYVVRRDAEQSFLPKSKMQVIYNGIDLSRFRPGDSRGSGDRELNIAYVGQLIPEKGVDLLLQAINALIAEGTTGFNLKIAGAGDQAEYLKQYAAENNLTQVEFLGQIDWVPQLYSTADIIVVPSAWEEACAFVIMEAMASGACLLVSDAGGNPEQVGESGEAGSIFRKGSVEDLKVKLRELMTDPARRERLRRNAHARAVRMFDIDRMVCEYADLFDAFAEK